MCSPIRIACGNIPSKQRRVPVRSPYSQLYASWSRAMEPMKKSSKNQSSASACEYSTESSVSGCANDLLVVVLLAVFALAEKFRYAERIGKAVHVDQAVVVSALGVATFALWEGLLPLP